MIKDNIRMTQAFLDCQVRALPDSADGTHGAVQVVASTEAPVQRYDWGSDQFFNEVLDMQESSIRLGRMKRGLSVLDTHAQCSLRAVLGKTVGFTIENRQLVLDVKFSNRSGVEDIVSDIRDGIISAVSIGYRVYSFKEEGEDINGIKTFRATDWEPLEVSFVSVPADPEAMVKDESRQYSIPVSRNNPENVEMSDNEKKVDTKADAKVDAVEIRAAEEASPAPAAPTLDVEAIRKAEIARQSDIRSACKSVSLDGDFADKLCNDPAVDIHAARQLIINECAVRDSRKIVANVSAGDHNPVDNARQGLENAVLHRSRGEALNDNGRRFLGGHHGFGRMIATYMSETAPGTDYSRLSVQDLVTRGLTTSDFPLTLANTANKMLKGDFEKAAQTYEALVKRTTLSNFNTHDRIRNEADFKLRNRTRSKTPEKGKAKYGDIAENREQITLSTYRAEMSVTREMLINDDLNAFSRIPTNAANAIRELEAALVYADVILANKALVSDGVALFHSASHSNDTASNALSAAGAVNTVRQKMLTQKNLAGRYLRVHPNILLVPPALEKDALSHTSLIRQLSTSSDIAQAIIAKNLEPVVEPLLSADNTLDGGSDTIWYLISTQDPDMLIELATLQDPTGLTSAISVNRVTNEGIIYGVLHDAAAQPMDYRAMARSAA